MESDLRGGRVLRAALRRPPRSAAPGGRPRWSSARSTPSAPGRRWRRSPPLTYGAPSWARRRVAGPDRLRHRRDDLRRRPGQRRRDHLHARDLARRPLEGHITGIRSVDVKSIGAGGGASSGSTPAGCCGSARRAPGADPGPACYGRGGERPTVTDAAVVLGYIDPDYFLGGRDGARRRRRTRAIAGPRAGSSG